MENLKRMVTSLRKQLLLKEVEIPEYFIYEIEYLMQNHGVRNSRINVALDMVMDEIIVYIDNKPLMILEYEYTEDMCIISDAIIC